MLRLEGVRIRTLERGRTTENRGRARTLASLRLVIESTIGNLKCQVRLEQHLAKTPPAFRSESLSALLALSYSACC